MSKAFQQGQCFLMTHRLGCCKPDLTKIQTKVFPVVGEVSGKTGTVLILDPSDLILLFFVMNEIFAYTHVPLQCLRCQCWCPHYWRDRALNISSVQLSNSQNWDAFVIFG